MVDWIGIGVTALVSCLALVVEHYAPWRLLFGREIHRTINYVIGMAALELPMTVLFILWRAWPVIIALWIVTIAGGLAVLGAYLLDGWIASRNNVHVVERENQILRSQMGGANDPRSNSGLQ